MSNIKKTNKKTVKSAPSTLASSASSSTNYTLVVKNNSSEDNMMCLYQDTVAWLVEPCGSGDTLEFQWNLEYGVFWKKTDDSSDTTSTNSQEYPANPRDGSSFILEVSDSGFVKLNPADENGPSGAIYIDAAGSVGQGVISTGVTLSGSPIDAKMAYPDMNYTFTISPTPTYWLAFGDFTEGGTVDTTDADTTPIKVEFQTGVYELYFHLGADYQFSQVTDINGF